MVGLIERWVVLYRCRDAVSALFEQVSNLIGHGREGGVLGGVKARHEWNLIPMDVTLSSSLDHCVSCELGRASSASPRMGWTAVSR